MLITFRFQKKKHKARQTSIKLLCIRDEMNKNVKGKQRLFRHPQNSEKKTISALLSATAKRLSKDFLYTTYKNRMINLYISTRNWRSYRNKDTSKP